MCHEHRISPYRLFQFMLNAAIDVLIGGSASPMDRILLYPGDSRHRKSDQGLSRVLAH